MLRFIWTKGIVVVLFGLWMVGGACTKYAKPTDLQRLEEVRQSVRKAEEELNQLRQEKNQLERQLSQKRAELKEAQDHLKEIKGE